jgi:hypothetical protein
MKRTAFTVSSLKSFWAGTYSWRSAISSVHALWKAQSLLAILSDVAFCALAHLIFRAVAIVEALFITFRIGSLIMVNLSVCMKRKRNVIFCCYHTKSLHAFATH